MEINDWSTERLLQTSGSYWATCALHAGVKLDLFSQLETGPATAADLARRIGGDSRGVGMLANSLAALGLLSKQGQCFANTDFAGHKLVRSSPDYLGHILMHHHHLMESWSHLDRSVKTGGPLRDASAFADAEWRESFLLGMFNLANQLAPKMVPQIDLGNRRRLLDLGGGPGTWALHFCRHHPQLQAVVFDLPTTRPFAEATIQRFELTARVSFAAGDFLVDPLPRDCDIAWLSHILHGEGPEDAARIVALAAAALPPGGLLLVHEFILEDDGAGPVFPALFSLNMLLGTEGGQSYTNRELSDMLRQAGCREVRRLPVRGPNDSGVLAGVV
jgi:SAM-dependent methyltransferase